MTFFWKKYDLEDLEVISYQDSLSKSTLERRALVRIASVDDKQFQPLDNLRDCGFDVIHIGSLSDVRPLDPYEIVLCDIQGVALKMSKEFEGAALIKEIKRLYPAKIVIAYTSLQNRDPRAKEALKYADDNIAKQAELEIWIRMLDEHVKTVLDPVVVWKSARQQLLNQNVPARIVAKAEHAYVKSIINGTNTNFKTVVGKLKLGDDVRAILQSLVGAAIWAALVA